MGWDGQMDMYQLLGATWNLRDTYMYQLGGYKGLLPLSTLMDITEFPCIHNIRGQIGGGGGIVTSSGSHMTGMFISYACW